MGSLEEKDRHRGCVEYPNCECPRCERFRRYAPKGDGSAQPKWTQEMRKLPCHYCGGKGGTIDHIRPKSQGGHASKDNCVPACRECNTFRGNRDYEEFKKVGWKRRPFI